ncbi:Probable dual-specificity RNA methyltransferase RlmN [Linum perenne]
MIAAASTSLFQQVCAASVVRPGFRSRSVASVRYLSTVAAAASSAKSVAVSRLDSRVLLGLSEPELQQLALDLGQEGYRGKQLHHLIYKRKVKEVEDFINLPQAFRSVLQEAGWRVGRSPVFQTVTAADGTIKLLIKLEDNRLVETVGIPVTDDKDVEIGQRMITISTVGVPNTIKKLSTHKLQSTLAFSIHAPNQKLRETIVPSAKSYPLDAIMKDIREAAGVNDNTEHAIELAELLNKWGRNYHVNLIPFNPIEGSEYKRPTNRGVCLVYENGFLSLVQNFASTLQARKITVSIRKSRGMDASAACGQLRNQFQKSPLLTAEPDVSRPEAELAVT